MRIDVTTLLCRCYFNNMSKIEKHIEIKCLKCNVTRKGRKRTFVDKTLQLCNNCAVPRHVCGESCNDEWLCCRCSILKPLRLFVTAKNRKTGHDTICKECKSLEMSLKTRTVMKENTSHDCSILGCASQLRHCRTCKMYHPLSWFGPNRTSFTGHRGDCNFQMYLRNAQRRDIAFELVPAEFWEICSKPCAYCDDTSLPNGVDRINSLGAYTKDNTNPACTVCNRAKSNMSLEEFYDWIERISKAQKNNGIRRD